VRVKLSAQCDRRIVKPIIAIRPNCVFNRGWWGDMAFVSYGVPSSAIRPQRRSELLFFALLIGIVEQWENPPCLHKLRL
jgi:hypothetical protein